MHARLGWTGLGWAGGGAVRRRALLIEMQQQYAPMRSRINLLVLLLQLLLPCDNPAHHQRITGGAQR